MSYEPIQKPCIFLTSSGRTGTRYFGTLLQKIIQNCASYHEPDVMTKNELDHWRFVVREFGLISATVGKALPKGNLRSLGVARVRGHVTDDEAIQALRKWRNSFIEHCPHEFYCEANQQLLLFVDLLPIAFPNSKTVYTLRDPRDWVRSCMNIPDGWFTWTDFTQTLPNGKLTPRYFPDDPYADDWPRLSRFEKLSWAWNAYNSFAIQRLGTQPHVRIEKFEDLFDSSTGEASLSELLDDITRFPDGHQADWHLEPGTVNQKIHSARQQDCGHWTQWNPIQKEQLDRHCGKLMRQFGYGIEPDWLLAAGRCESVMT